MQNNVLHVSENFRKMAVKSVLSIVFFLFTYIVLIILAIGLVLLCGLIAYTLITLQAMFLTAMLGLGFIGMGFLIFFFLIKFIFSSPKKVDRSHLVEISKAEQPELFKLINEIVKEVKTDFPKKVYLSSDVNASVFYDSNFWSMFFPVRKNLQIGLGLMNTVSALELKAILAHEFGHFSQRSMKVGSYVYHVNKVIYNMLYDNESYGDILNNWSNISSYFSLFAKGAILVIQGIQHVLLRVYNRLNLNYMALSREMEFHADAVAAGVAGSQPLVSSLLRLGLADQSLNRVFDYYNSKIELLQKTNNFYPQQFFVMSRLAFSENLQLHDGLPSLSIAIYKRFNKTKLVLDNQWSSHPNTEERVERLMALNIPQRETHTGLAMDLLSDKEKLQEMITAQMFAQVNYTSEPVVADSGVFMEEYLKREEEASFPGVYNGYFDVRDPYVQFTLADFEISGAAGLGSFEAMIDDAVIGDVKSLEAATSDLQIIESINNGGLEINTFDYDGDKYTVYDAYPLMKRIEEDISRLKESLEENEKRIFGFFLNHALVQGKIIEFQRLSLNFQLVSQAFKLRQAVYIDLANATYFMHTTTPFETITENMYQVKRLEQPFKEQVSQMLEETLFSLLMEEQVKARFEEYLSKDWKYFGHQTYFDKEVEVLFAAMADYLSLIFTTHFNTKKALLEFQASLIESASMIA